MRMDVYVKSVVLPHSTRHNCEVERRIKQVWKLKHVARKITQVWKPKQVGKVWKPTGKVLTTIGHQWRPTGQILHLGTQCPLTRFTPPQVVSIAQSKKQANTCANQKEPNHNWGSKVPNSPSLSGFKCRTSQQNGVVERRNRTLVEAARTMLIFSKALMFLWAEAVATVCYTKNCSLIHTCHYKTPYKLVHTKKPDLTFFRVFGTLCYPTNDSEDLGKLQPTADTRIFVGYAPSRKGYRIYNKRTRRIMETIHISSGLVPNPVPATPYAPPTNKELEILFQPMFDEYLDPLRANRPGFPAQAVQPPVSSAGTPLSTTIDQDAPSPHISPSSSTPQSHNLPPGVVAEPHLIEDHNVALVNDTSFVNIFAPEPPSEASSSGDISSTESPYVS
nr:hypothetical protein [Tanacetum cinerariifolium]